MSETVTAESEQVEVSASKLQMLIATQQENKEKHLKEVAQLKAQLKAKEMEIKLYDDAIHKMKTMRHSKSLKAGDNTKRVMEEISKSRKFDEWYEKNKEKLIEEEYNKNHKAEVEALRNKLNKLVDS